MKRETCSCRQMVGFDEMGHILSVCTCVTLEKQKTFIMGDNTSKIETHNHFRLLKKQFEVMILDGIFHLFACCLTIQNKVSIKMLSFNTLHGLMIST